jgi:hypothetical protein
MKVLLRIIKSSPYIFINICEKKFLGKVFKQGNIVIDVNNEFYDGEEVSIDYAFSLVDEATIVNIVGDEIVEEAIRRGIVHRDSVIKIGEVKFAQLYNI